MATDHFLLFFIFDHLSKTDAVFVEVFEHTVFVLIVAITAERNLLFVTWLLTSFCNELVELIARFLYPFADGECNKEFCFPFYVDVSVRIALLIVAKVFALNSFLFFLT